MSALPLVLAGPIVRRVESRACSIWVALRDTANVTVKVWPATQMAGTGDAPLAQDTSATRRFGKQLHVAVVTVHFKQPLPPLIPGSLHSYDVTFSGAFGNESLKSVGLLKDEQTNQRIPGVHADAPLHKALGYIENRLPTFVTPAGAIGGLKLAHSSCRKTVGPGYDANAWLDKPIQDHFDNPSERIQQLFLTGDQIYADEMSSCLLSMLVELGNDVVGAENLKVDANTTIDAALGNFQPYRRQKLVRDLAGFTSEEASDHLIAYREFAAMYLAAWSPRVWRPLGTIDEVFQFVRGNAHPSVQDHLTHWEKCAEEQTPPTTYRQLKEDTIKEHNKRVEVYRSAVPYVARVLANCATYMIFDDHEVTDDWNLHKKWQNRVYSKPLGRNIVRNGVMAYTVFQGWGNDPEAFGAGKNKELLDEISNAAPDNKPFPGDANIQKLDQLTGCTANPGTTATFGYRVPGPRHMIIVLDTRTRRSFRGQGYMPPALLGASLNDQIPAGPLTDGRELLIVVSAPPVLGPHIIDKIAQPLLQNVWDAKNVAEDIFMGEPGPCEPAGRVAGGEHLDAEAWIADEVAFEELLKRIAPYERAVILSGDVHFSCSLVLDYWRNGVTAPSRIVQLTSSPSRNDFKPVIEAVLRSTALLQAYAAGPLPERLGWNGKSSIVIPDGVKIGPGRRARMRRSPALLPTRNWPAGTTIPADKAPDWRWRLTLQRDSRPESVRPTALQQRTLPTDIDPTNAIPGYVAVAKRHMQAALTHFDHLRQLVFTQAIGVIDFDQNAAGAIKVTHTVLSKDAPNSVTPAENTVHEVDLIPTTEPIPDLVTRA